MKKRGWPRRIGQRLAVILLLLFQLLFAVYALVSGSLYSVYIRSALCVMSFAVAVFVIAGQDKSAYKLTWTTLILLFPAFGGLFYLLYRLQSSAVQMRRRLSAAKIRSQQYLTNTHSENSEACAQFPAYCTLISFLEQNAGYPIYGDCRALYLSPGEKKLEKLLEELSKAEKYIFLEYFIVEPGKMWDSVFEILKNKARAGIDVRLIYDDFGCVTTLPYQYYKSLQQVGIKCAAFNQFRPVLNVILNNRDHRKIAVIDGHTAFTGGINLADEYINRKERFGHWKDSGICLHGEAVWSFTVMFLQMWSTITGMECNFESYRPEIYHEEAFKKDGFVQPYGDSPLDGETVGEHVYLNIISQAKKYLYIFTPYLIPDNETLTALCMAAKRGVDVRIVTPGIPDKKIVYILTQANYEILLESGVQIYQYTPGFIHSKSFVCDDEVATVGTINMDYRSMYLHFECGVWMYGSSAVAQVKEDALTTFEQCEQINMDYCRKKNFAVRALRGALKFLAPLL